MRTRNAIERLAAVAPPDMLLDSDDEDRILQRILGSDRRAVRRRRPIMLALIAATVVGAVVAVAFGHRSGNHTALSGARIELSGFSFRTPAGFKKESNGTCGGDGTGSFAVAASADGGCVAVSAVLQPNPTLTLPTPVGQPVDVGSLQGYYDAQGHDVHGEPGAVLSVELPRVPNSGPTDVVLFSQGLTEDQLIAVAESGLAPFHLR